MIQINKYGIPVLDADDYVWVSVKSDVSGKIVECVWQELTEESEKRVSLGDKVVYGKYESEKEMIGTVLAIGPVVGVYDARSVYFADPVM